MQRLDGRLNFVTLENESPKACVHAVEYSIAICHPMMLSTTSTWVPFAAFAGALTLRASLPQAFAFRIPEVAYEPKEIFPSHPSNTRLEAWRRIQAKDRAHHTESEPLFRTRTKSQERPRPSSPPRDRVDTAPATYTSSYRNEMAF